MCKKFIMLMKKIILNLFRLFKSSPTTSGFLLLMIVFHLAGVRSSPQSMLEVYLSLIYICIMAICGFFIVPKIEQNKREKLTWCVVGLSIVLLTCIAKMIT